MSATIDITPEGGFWVVEARPTVLAIPAMPGREGRAPYLTTHFPAETMARARTIADAMTIARALACINEVHARNWPEYCRARSISEALSKVQAEFVDGPDPRD